MFIVDNIISNSWNLVNKKALNVFGHGNGTKEGVYQP